MRGNHERYASTRRARGVRLLRGARPQSLRFAGGFVVGCGIPASWSFDRSSPATAPRNPRVVEPARATYVLALGTDGVFGWLAYPARSRRMAGFRRWHDHLSDDVIADGCGLRLARGRGRAERPISFAELSSIRV